MANRVSATDVKGILETALDNPAIEVYIGMANTMVTDTVTCGLSDSTMKELERWLTAHMITVTKERMAVSEKLGEAEVKYAGVYGPGLSSTSFGQMVLQLDTCGSFANLGKKAASMTAVTSFKQ